MEAYEVTETATYDSEAEGQATTCTTNVSGDVETVDCMELKNYAELQQNLSIQVSADQE